jgi:pantoate--beta-alanine ligase
MTLKAIDSQSTQAVVLMAAFLGDVRLIDNKVIDLN